MQSFLIPFLLKYFWVDPLHFYPFSWSQLTFIRLEVRIWVITVKNSFSYYFHLLLWLNSEFIAYGINQRILIDLILLTMIFHLITRFQIRRISRVFNDWIGESRGTLMGFIALNVFVYFWVHDITGRPNYRSIVKPVWILKFLAFLNLVASFSHREESAFLPWFSVLKEMLLDSRMRLMLPGQGLRL